MIFLPEKNDLSKLINHFFKIQNKTTFKPCPRSQKSQCLAKSQTIKKFLINVHGIDEWMCKWLDEWNSIFKALLWEKWPIWVMFWPMVQPLELWAGSEDVWLLFQVPFKLSTSHITRDFTQSVEIDSTQFEIYFSSSTYFAILSLLRTISHKLVWFSHIPCLCSYTPSQLMEIQEPNPGAGFHQ